MELSASRINTFLNCFGQYKFKYVDELETEDERTWPNTVVGTVMHNILEDIFLNHRDKSEAQLKNWLKDKFAQYYHRERKELKKRGITFVETRAFNEPQFIQDGEKKLKSFALFAYRYFNSFKTLHPELEIKADWDYIDGVSMKGIIDLIAEEDDFYNIIDFKTTSKREKWLFTNYFDDVQSKLYTYLTDKHFGKTAESFEYLIYAHMDKMIFFSPRNELKQMTKGEKKKFYLPIDNIIKDIIKKVEKPKIEYFNPDQTRCFWCPFREKHCEVAR